MYTCPKCLKKYKCLSRHLSSSSCITINVKPAPKKKGITSKYKKVTTHIVTNKMNVTWNHPSDSKNDYDESNHTSNICDRHVIDDNESIPYHLWNALGQY